MKICLALLLVFLPFAASHAAQNDPSKVLADQVSDIAHASNLSPKEKDAEIQAAVHAAVVAAIADITNPEEILKISLELTTAAANSAPQYTQSIIGAISTVPAIADIKGALNTIQDAVVDTAAKAAQVAFNSDKDKHDSDQDHDHDHDHHDDDDFPVSPSR